MPDTPADKPHHIPVNSLQPTRPLPSEGSLTLRVRYCECDPMGVVHHASYAPWLEMGRTEILRASGVTYAAMEQAGIFLVIVKLDIRYRRPVKYDDLVEIRTKVKSVSRVKIEHEYDVIVIERDSAKAEIHAAVATTTLACVDPQGKVRELPAWLT